MVVHGTFILSTCALCVASVYKSAVVPMSLWSVVVCVLYRSMHIAFTPVGACCVMHVHAMHPTTCVILAMSVGHVHGGRGRCGLWCYVRGRASDLEAHKRRHGQARAHECHNIYHTRNRAM